VRTPPNDDRAVEARLRAALQERADAIVPAGDGLQRIRDHTARRRRLNLLWPALSAATVAAAIAVAVLVVPSMLRPGGNPQRNSAAGGAATSQPVASSAPVAPTRPTPTGGTPTAPASRISTPPTGPSGAGTTTAWPYANAADAMAGTDAKAHPELADPVRTAVSFIESLVGNNTGFTGRTSDSAAGVVRVAVRSAKPAPARPVCTVSLVPVRTGTGQIYLVRSATTTALTLRQVGKMDGTRPLAVSGAATLDAGQVPKLHVYLSLPAFGSPTLSFQQPVITSSGTQRWSATLNPARAATSGVVSVWTTDSAGNVVDFAARPAS